MAKFNRYQCTQISTLTGEITSVRQFGTWRVAERHANANRETFVNSVLIYHNLQSGIVMRFSGFNCADFMRLMNEVTRFAQVLCTPVGWTQIDA